ncbi:zinc dependent phospholipase C family protein [Butyrivibrio sp. VCD2006]|uniref:zinc dependent phospholipase C family protein n=1 Tax=Butyrivibrio sp. VCD2006 TaxID=1280664 RepID=UPI000427942C|nr:zinc dependent phospholipase C family protein [Butyrivibrio sp. VCD2006]
MAGQMTHMVIAHKLIEKLGIDEGKEEFILGSVAPDSVHFSEDYLPKKIHSHLFENCGPWGDTQDYDNWIVNIKAFWNKYVVNETDQIKRSFLLGIVVHCLTDYWNDLLIWRALQKKMIPPMGYDEFKEAYYPESFRIDRWLYQNTQNAEEIMKLLHDSKEFDFEDYLRKAEICKMKDNLINVQYNLPEPIDVSGHRYYPADMMLWFIEEVPDRIYGQLNEFQ